MSKDFYEPEDSKNLSYEKDLADPGNFPFTRGIHKDMYKERFWTMRQFAGFGTAEDTNERFKYLLSQSKGEKAGLSVAFHLPTLNGLDSDHPLSEGEVGRNGVAIDTLKDMEILFDGIPLGQVSTSMTINSTAAVALAMYLAVAEKQGVSFDKLEGTVQNDLLKEFIAQNTQIYPIRPSVKLVIDVVEYCVRYVPKWNTISISGYHIREKGATASQELAFTLADGIAYVKEAVRRGLDVDSFAPRFSFFFDCHNDFFEEIAKFRASRRMWAKIMKEKFLAKDEKSWKMRFHTQTAGCTLTFQQPLNNIARVAYQALAAVLGGTQSLHTNSFDEQVSLPSVEAVTVALRTQQIIAHETGITEVIDPLAGSYFIESLTDKIEKEANEYLKKIDSFGGMIRAIEAGYPQREIESAAASHQRALEKKEIIEVGVNAFSSDAVSCSKPFKINPGAIDRQLRRLKEIKSSRGDDSVKHTLANLKRAAMAGENTFSYILDAVKSYATVGEISDALRDVFGEYQQDGTF